MQTEMERQGDKAGLGGRDGDQEGDPETGGH